MNKKRTPGQNGDEPAGLQLGLAGVPPGGVGHLGNDTKSIFTPGKSNTYAGPRLTPAQISERRQLRYRMQRQAAQTLGRNHRVAVCQRVASYGVQHGGGNMGISINEQGRAAFHGVGSCGDVWCCPICALRIAEGRRLEVLAALRAHRAAGGIAVLATFTFSHHRDGQLADQVQRLARALARLKSSRRYKLALEGAGYLGQVRALEVMHGTANGWHPHVHEIWFLQRADIDPGALGRLRASIFELWRDVCVRAGLGEPDREHGFTLEYRKATGVQSAVGAYVAKWGHELTHLHAKQGKLGSRSPWAILEALTLKWTWGDSSLFREYAAAVKGRAQLFWSRGLKKHFQIEDIADQTLADLPAKLPLADLDAVHWKAIVYFDAHYWVLDIAEQKPLFLTDLLERLKLLYERRCTTERIKKYELKRTVREMTLKHIAELEKGIAL